MMPPELNHQNEASFDISACHYYEKIMSLMEKGGVICIDNTLWKGRVYDSSINNSSTQSIRDINKLINSDKRVEHSLLTIYDGMTICYVK